MTVLLTGSSGWLGRALAPRLKREGHGVVGLDIVPGEHTTVIGSVADRALVDRLFAEGGSRRSRTAGRCTSPISLAIRPAPSSM